jgi:hypothetical protein
MGDESYTHCPISGVRDSLQQHARGGAVASISLHNDGVAAPGAAALRWGHAARAWTVHRPPHRHQRAGGCKCFRGTLSSRQELVCMNDAHVPILRAPPGHVDTQRDHCISI